MGLLTCGGKKGNRYIVENRNTIDAYYIELRTVIIHRINMGSTFYLSLRFILCSLTVHCPYTTANDKHYGIEKTKNVQDILLFKTPKSHQQTSRPNRTFPVSFLKKAC